MKELSVVFLIKHSFGDSKVALNENGEILTEDVKIAKTFNSYFESIRDSLDLFEEPLQSNISYEKVQNIFIIFSNYPIIIKINQNSS